MVLILVSGREATSIRCKIEGNEDDEESELAESLDSETRDVSTKTPRPRGSNKDRSTHS